MNSIRNFSDEQLSIALGRQIAAERTAQGISQEQLAAAIGVHKNTVYRYETGDREITWGAIKKISAALQVLPSKILAAAEDRARLGAIPPAEGR